MKDQDDKFFESRKMIILFPVILVLFTMGCYQTKFTKNDSSEDGFAIAKRDIKTLKITLKDKSPEELIASFIPDGPHKYAGYEYYYKYIANSEIKKELKNRGAAARSALQAHINDNTQIWEAINGPGNTIGDICKELLNAETHAKDISIKL